MKRMARAPATRIRANSVEEYLAAVPADARATLQKLRKMIRAVVPQAEEVISYQVPTFKYQGGLVAYAAFDEHCSFFVMSPPVMKAHAAELKGYETSAGTIRFPIGKPLPAALVRKLVRARIAENKARGRGKKR